MHSVRTKYYKYEDTNNAMEKYVDGFVLVVPKNKRDEYRTMAQEGRDVWMKYGALQYFECVGDDLEPKVPAGMEGMEQMMHRRFPDMAGSGSDEEVWFSFIIFNSREHRDEVNAKVMEEMAVKAKEEKDTVMPFEMNNMAYGGFTVLVEG